MARFFDDLSQFLSQHVGRNFLQETVCFDIAGVANYFWSHAQRGWDDWRDGYPTIAPVFEDCWMEGRRPLVNEITNAERLNIESIPYRWGVRFTASNQFSPSIPYARFLEMTSNDTDATETGHSLEGLGNKLALEDNDLIQWVVLVSTWTQPEKNSLVRTGQQVDIAIDPQGLMLGQPVIYPNDPRYPNSSAWKENDGKAELDLLRVSLFALSLLHCKNVARVEHAPDAALQRARQRRNKPPLTKFYTLEIEPMKQVLKKEGGIESNGLKKALHICRGHFATYSPDRPLFGRVAGKFWIPAHARGSKSAGEAVKDYAIKKPVSSV